jgi:hypothetical protein
MLVISKFIVKTDTTFLIIASCDSLSVCCLNCIYFQELTKISLER